MTETAKPSKRRILASLRRLRRDGETLLRERPLDEIAHAKWIERAQRYLQKRMPDVHVAPPDELVPVQMPALLDPAYRRPHPTDAAFARANSGRELAEKHFAIIASAEERLELKVETEEN